MCDIGLLVLIEVGYINDCEIKSIGKKVIKNIEMKTFNRIVKCNKMLKKINCFLS